MIAEIQKSAEERMEKSIESLSHEFGSIRTGRASASMLERVVVDYYGVPTPIPQLAAIKSPEAHLLVVEPWDKSLLSEVERAILASDLGITPNSDGSLIRLPFPPPTEERHKELVKECRQVAEDARVSVRNARRDANNKLERAKKDGEASEDDVRRAEAAIQKLTDSYVTMVEETLERKEAEVMEI